MKLFYVYYAIQTDGRPKVGASINPNKRKRASKYQEIILLEEFDCPIKCGDREIELQLKYFGKRDNSAHYASMINKSFYQTEEFKTKQSERFKRLWENERENMMKNIAIGINHGRSKLTEEDVKFIRKAYFKCVNRFTLIPKGKMSITQLANKFNCTKQSILNVANGKRWKHVI